MFNPGDKVRFRDDATSGGQPIGDFFRRTTWTVVSCQEDALHLQATADSGSDLQLHTFPHKMRLAEASEL